MKYTSAALWAALALTSTSFAAVLKTNKDGTNQQPADPTEGKANIGNVDAQQAEELCTYDGVECAAIPSNLMPQGRAALAANAVKLSPNGWIATADSFQAGNEPQKAIDGNANTFWHTPWGTNGAGFPHHLTIDMRQSFLINTIAMQPRQDGSKNGNIGQHQILTSTDGTTWSSPKVLGTWRDDASTKTSIFEATQARFVRLTANTEAGGRGPWSSVAEFSVYSTPNPAPPYAGISGGSWSPTIDFPIVPVAAAILYNSGNMLTWSSYAADTFGGASGGKTVTSTYFPGSMTVTQRTVTNIAHDMFCPGLNLDSRGRVFVTGGNNAEKTSQYEPPSDAWTNVGQIPNMNIARGYQSQTTLSDGRTFVIGGSWSGGSGNKNGEVYSISQNRWSLLPGCPVSPMLTQDAQDTNNVYRSDNHAWLFGWKAGWVLQAGPSRRMNWYNTNGLGANNVAGTRNNDGDAMCGVAVMYDITADGKAKILTAGGAQSYQGVDATANAYILTVGDSGAAVATQTINPMYHRRTFHNGVVMPNGNVLIVGGQVRGMPFSDDTAQLQPEIFVAATNRFITVPNINVPRTYHSVALLLADGTIFAGGGGLCGGCATNHFDGQIYFPGYLFNADGSRATRPVINSATGQVRPDGTITATTNGPVSSWSLVRLGSTTHTVNTDQRRIPLRATNSGNTYTMKVPNDYGILLPGYYFLFAMNAANVPSVARYVFVPR